jgi:hypothetical protein
MSLEEGPRLLSGPQKTGVINSRRWRREIKTGQRFWSRVVRQRGCWKWNGYHDPSGYAKVTFLQNPTYAHRIAYELTKGRIPAGKVIDHLCNNRSCVNPAHLKVTDHRTNILRGTGQSARNAVKISCIRGHAFASGNRKCRICINEKRRKGTGPARGESHPCALLTESNVRFIREHYGHVPLKILAGKFRVAVETICAVGKRRSWRYLA